MLVRLLLLFGRPGVAPEALAKCLDHIQDIELFLFGKFLGELVKLRQNARAPGRRTFVLHLAAAGHEPVLADFERLADGVDDDRLR